MRAGDQVGFTDYWMGSRLTLFTAEVITVPNEKQVLLKSTGFWGPLPGEAYALDQWFTWPIEDVFILEGEDLEYLHSFDD